MLLCALLHLLLIYRIVMITLHPSKLIKQSYITSFYVIYIYIYVFVQGVQYSLPNQLLLKVQVPYEPCCPSAVWLIGRSVGPSVIIFFKVPEVTLKCFYRSTRYLHGVH